MISGVAKKVDAPDFLPAPAGGRHGRRFLFQAAAADQARIFRNAPTQRKLMLIILGSYAAALLLTAAVHSSFRIFSEISDLDPAVAARFDGAVLAVILVISALAAKEMGGALIV